MKYIRQQYQNCGVGGQIHTAVQQRRKILSRLVDRAEQRLSEAEECLVWYERQRTQAREELAALRSLIEELRKTEE